MKTITLTKPLNLQDAVISLMNGECLGIRPGQNTNYMVIDAACLKWKNTENRSIRTNQITGKWFLVIADHRELPV